MQNMMPNQNNDRIKRYGGSPSLNSDNIFNAWLEQYPSENLVDQYLQIDQANPSIALPWNETSQYKNNFTKITTNLSANVVDSAVVKTDVRLNDIIYKNRDKRFYASVVYDSSMWYGETITTCILGNMTRWIRFTGAGYYAPLSNYLWKKCIYTNVTPRIYAGVPTDYHYVLMRLGRVYLNLAEALLQQGKVTEAVEALNQTRVIHGGLPASTANNLEDAWTDYKRERSVDLTLEGDYYWSLLRWGKYGGFANYSRPAGGKIKELDEDKPMYIEIAKNRKSYSIGYVTLYQNNERRFDENRRYLFPIPYGEIKRNEKLVQNEGW